MICEGEGYNTNAIISYTAVTDELVAAKAAESGVLNLLQLLSARLLSSGIFIFLVIHSIRLLLRRFFVLVEWMSSPLSMYDRINVSSFPEPC